MLDLQTRRLYMQPIRETDWPLFSTLHQQPEVIRYLFDETTLEQTRERFESRLPAWTLDSSHWLCLVIRERQTQAPLGVTGLKLSEHSASEAEVGYLLLHEHQGKGYGSESLRALTDYASQTLGIKTLFATVTDGNTASCKVLEKCGYVFAKRQPLAYQLRGEAVDDLIFRWRASP